MNKRDVIKRLIEQECLRNGFASEDRVKKMATILNITPEEYGKIIDRLISWGDVKRDSHTLTV